MSQPTWNTVAGSLGSYASGSTVNYILSAVSTSSSTALRYNVQSGSLPPGLSLNVYTAVISGTVSSYKVDTTYTFTVRATDGSLNLRDRTFSMMITKDVSPNFVTASGTLFTTLDTTWVYQKVPYTTSLSDTSVTITVSSGSLPPGLEISTDGLIQGYCSAVSLATTYTFTLKISNTIGSNTRIYTILVNPTVIYAAPNRRLPTILNSRPLSSILSTNDPNYGYYRSSDITQFTGSISVAGIATVEGAIGCTVGAGSGSYSVSSDTLIISQTDGWILPGTEIEKQLSGVIGGAGTYKLGKFVSVFGGVPTYQPITAQTTSSTNIYAIDNINGGHATFTGSITGTTLTVTAVSVGTIGTGQKLYTPRDIFVDDIVTDGTISAKITGLPYGSGNSASSGAFTLYSAVTFTGPITVISNKFVISQFNSGNKLIRGDRILGSGILPNTYVADQIYGVTGGEGVYVLDRYQYSPYGIFAVNRATLAVTSITRGTIKTGRVIQTATGSGIVSNTLIVDQISPLLPGETFTGIGRYTVSIGQTLASTTIILDVDIGTYYYDDYFSFKILGYDFDNRNVTYTYSVTTLPPGLTLNPATGWITGIPTGIGTTRYNFTVAAINSLGAASQPVTFSVAFSSSYSNSITWVTSADLGKINNYHISNLSLVAKVDNGVGEITYRVVDGVLPPALELLDSGLIVGRVSYDPVAYNIQAGEITTFNFTVEAYTLNYPSIVSSNRTFTIKVYNKYQTPIETVYIKCTPNIADRRLLIGNADSLFGSTQRTLTTVTVTDGTNNTLKCASTAVFKVGSIIQFSGTTIGGVSSGINYYVVSIPTSTTFKVSTTSGGSVASLATATGSMSVTSTIIPSELLYRSEDPYYGLNTQIVCDHIYGVNASDAAAYITAVHKKHYKRRFTLGELKTAVARDSNNNIIYEVVYCHLIDNLINKSGTSINYEITWPTPIPINDIIVWYDSLGDVYTSYDVVNGIYYYTSLIWGYRTKLYPNSLKNMETSLVADLGRQSDTSLMPAWMTSQQTTGGTLGYTPAWVICYTQPGASSIVKSNIEQLWPYTMNLINFELDRVLVDKSLTFNYDSTIKRWKSLPSGTLKPITITGTVAPNQLITTGSLADWHVDLAFTLSSTFGSGVGGLDVNIVYYVRSIDDTITPNRLTVSKSLNGATEILTTSSVAAGQAITATPIHPGPQPIDSKDYMILYDHTTILY